MDWWNMGRWNMDRWNAVVRTLTRLRLTGVAVVVLLTLGISLSLVVFCFVNAMLLRPLPFPDSENLVALQDQTGNTSLGISWGEVQQWENAPSLFRGAAAFRRRTWALTDHTGAPLQVVLSGMVTPGFFGVLLQEPALGALLPETPGGDPHVAVLSYRLWQRRYGGSAGVLNTTLSLNDVPYRILGVLPEGFDFSAGGADPEIYIPLGEEYCCALNQRGSDGIARLAPGVSLAAANQHLQAFAQRTAQSEGLLQFRSTAIPLHAFVTGSTRKPLLLLWLCVLAVTFIASLNAGALLLARALRNLRQYALKITFGARLRDLVQEQATLAVILSAAAGTAALLVSATLLRVLQRAAFLQDLLGNMHAPGSLWDWRVFCFCALLSLAASMAACLLPLVLLRGMPVERLLRANVGVSPTRHGRRLRTMLITTQLALSVTLLSAVFSFGHSLYTLLNRNPGFRTRNIVMGGIGIPDARYDTDAKMVGFHEQALASIRTIPGVNAVGFGGGAPIHPLKTRFAMDGSPENAWPLAQRPRVDVNQSFARQYLDPGDPMKRGMHIQFYNGFSMKSWSHYTIVGIVADSRGVTLDKPPAPEIYLSTQQVPIEGGDYFLDTTRPASSLAEELPAAIWRIDSTLQRVKPLQMQVYLDNGFSSHRIGLDLALGFAAIAILLAAIGLGAGISASVSEAAKEIGIRAALGESRQSIALRVLRLSLLRTLLGTGCGVAGAVALSRVATFSLDPQLPFDYWALPVVLVSMLVLAACVTIAPARRALGISPMDALRAE